MPSITFDPGLDPRALDIETLYAAVVETATHLNVLDHRFLWLLGEVERRDTDLPGARTTADWLNHACGMDLHTGRERVRVAKALGDLPLLGEAAERGELSYSKLRALTRVATPDNEASLLELARTATAAQLERYCRLHRRAIESEETALEEARHAARYARFWYEADGSLVLQARLDPEAGATVLTALDLAMDCHAAEQPPAAAMGDRAPMDGERPYALRARAAPGYPQDVSAGPESCVRRLDPTVDPAAAGPEQGSVPASAAGPAARPDPDPAVGPGPGVASPPLASRATTTVRRADALVWLAERLLEAGGQDPRSRGATPETQGVSQTSAPTPAPPPAPAMAMAREVTIHVDVEVLTRQGPGRCQLEAAPGMAGSVDAVALAAASARRAACDGALVAIVENAAGEPLAIGRRTRAIPPALRRALHSRDRGQCQFPGCTARHRLHAHHVRHWADGGETSLANLVSTCPFHHRLVHEGGYSVQADPAGGFRFLDPEGLTVLAPLPPDPSWRLRTLAGCRRIAERLFPSAATARWDGTPPDYGWMLSALLPQRRGPVPAADRPAGAA